MTTNRHFGGAMLLVNGQLQILRCHAAGLLMLIASHIGHFFGIFGNILSLKDMKFILFLVSVITTS
jgi:hypothetical protein